MRKSYLFMFSMLICMFLLMTSVLASADHTIENYVNKGQFEKAEQYCDRQKEPKKDEYYRILAKFCLDKGYLDKAGEYYGRIGDQLGLNNVAEICLAGGDDANAVKYYLAGGLPENEVFKKVANVALAKGNYEKALIFFAKAADKDGIKNTAIMYLNTNGSKTILTGDRYAFEYGVAISTDNKYLVTRSDECNVKLWDFDSGKELRTFTGHSDWIGSVAISTDNKYIVSGSGDHTVKLWDLAGGKELRTFTGHSDWIGSVVISTDNKYIVSGSGDHTVKLWDLESGQELHTFTGHSDWIGSVAISTDDKYIVSGSGDHTIKLWDLESGQELRTFTGHADHVRSVAISTDNKYIVSGSDDHTVKLWDLTSGKELRTFTGHADNVYSVAVSTDNKYLVSGGCDGTIRLWDLASGKELQTFEMHSGIIEFVTFLTDHQSILAVCGGATIKILPISQDAATTVSNDFNQAGYSNQDAMEIIGETYYSQSDYAAAVIWFNKANDFNGIDKVITKLTNLVKNGTLIAEQSMAKAALANIGDNQAGMKLIGETYYAQGDYLSAVTWFNKANDSTGINVVFTKLWNLLGTNNPG